MHCLLLQRLLNKFIFEIKCLNKANRYRHFAWCPNIHVDSRFEQHDEVKWYLEEFYNEEKLGKPVEAPVNTALIPDVPVIMHNWKCRCYEKGKKIMNAIIKSNSPAQGTWNTNGTLKI